MYAFRISSSLALAAIVLLLWFQRKNLKSFLKDKSTLPIAQRPYSLATTLIFYWTLLVVLSVCYIGIVSDNLPTIDKGVLILMGIVVGTTTAGKVIDTTQSTDPMIARSQDVTPSDGFLTDILSDTSGISVSRLQTVVFNVIYGFSFLSIVITQNTLYNFPEQTLTLLGISSGAYALLKIPENSAPTVTPAVVTSGGQAIPAEVVGPVVVAQADAGPTAPKTSKSTKTDVSSPAKNV